MSQFLFFTSKQISPGAGDNLIVPGMLVKLSELFYQKKKEGAGLESTQLIFLCPDAEESGLRGAREYVKEHQQELKNIPTFNVNMDSIYRLQDIQFLESEINGLVQLDSNIRDECQSIAKELGYIIPSIKIPFGGGSTDAAEFTKLGIPSLSIIGLDTKFSGDVPYHTAFDTTDKIEPEAVLACMQIAESFILQKDVKILS
jgi:Zn-dependent M28 family amino/carboxypeptidase